MLSLTMVFVCIIRNYYSSNYFPRKLPVTACQCWCERVCVCARVPGVAISTIWCRSTHTHTNTEQFASKIIKYSGNEQAGNWFTFGLRAYFDDNCSSGLHAKRNLLTFAIFYSFRYHQIPFALNLKTTGIDYNRYLTADN